MALVKRGIDIWTDLRALLTWRKSMDEVFELHCVANNAAYEQTQARFDALQHHVDVLEAQVASLQRKAKRELGY